MHSLPFNFNYDDTDILKALIKADSKLSELNGVVKLLPNPIIILNAAILGEAKESSEIENIVTTFDEIFKEITLKTNNPASKEVLNYRQAILQGARLIEENGFISTRMIEDIHKIIEPNIGGIRKIPGTVILNAKTKVVLYTPPQSEGEIRQYLDNLEQYMNNNDFEDVHPIIKMAMIHYQFETIHPFYDGNGRTGRIINILYLVFQKKLSLPILYLSKYINRTKDLYYQHLNQVRLDDKYIKDYLLYFINGVYETSVFTIDFIEHFSMKMKEAHELVQKNSPKIYTHELVNYLFYDFYTKNEYLRERLEISRNTASKYLKELVRLGLLVEEKIGKQILYKNTFLYDLMKWW